MATPKKSIALSSVAAAMLVGAIIAGFVGWRIHLTGLKGRISKTKSALKRLVLTSRIPPNQEVMDYLSNRGEKFDNKYKYLIQSVAVPLSDEAAGLDPQLFFQERYHSVEQVVERMSLARSVPTPELLGFPKELPPTDTVPRLLVQIELIEEAASLIFDHGVENIALFKIEDPEVVSTKENGNSGLQRLPVRVRLKGSLMQTLSVLEAFEDVRPLIDVRALRVTPEGSGLLDVELSLARYLVIREDVTDSSKEEEGLESKSRKSSKRTSRRSNKGQGKR